MKRTYLIRLTPHRIVNSIQTIEISLFEFLNQPEAQSQLFKLFPDQSDLYFSLSRDLDSALLVQLQNQMITMAGRFGFFNVFISIQSDRMYRLMRGVNHPLTPVGILGIWLLFAVMVMQVSAYHIRMAREWQTVLSNSALQVAKHRVNSVKPERMPTVNAQLLTRLTQSLATPLVVDHIALSHTKINLSGYLPISQVDPFIQAIQGWRRVRLLDWQMGSVAGGYAHVQLALAAE